MNKLYTVEEVSELVSVTPRTIRNYLKDGRISGRKIGGQWRFSDTEVQRLLSGEEPAQEPTAKLEKPTPYLSDPKESESAFEPTEEPPEDFFAQAEEEIYHEPPTVFHTDKNNNYIEYNPEASLASENFEAKVSTTDASESIAQQTQPAPPNQPAQLPYGMPIKSNTSHTTVPVASAADSPAFNPAFTNLDPAQPTVPAPPFQPVQPYISSPYGAQVPGNSQVNYMVGQIPQQGYASPHPNMPVYYTAPSPYTNPVLASPIYATPYAPYPGQQYPPQAPVAAPAEEPVVNYKPSAFIEEKETKKQVAATPADKAAQDKEFPFELSDIGTQVALFASEVHDCSQGPQICTMIDLYQSLASAKITSERLMEIADQESEFGTPCHCYVEFDTRYYISRYTLFGTSEFLARCLKLLG